MALVSNDRITCPNCGHDQVGPVRDLRQTIADDGTVLSYPDTFMRCSECGTSFYSHEQSLATSRARAGALRAHEKLLTPDEIRAIREELHLTQAGLEQALGVGPKTVVRWERGTVCQGRAVDKLLRVLNRMGPKGLESLTSEGAEAPELQPVVHEQHELAEWSLLINSTAATRTSGGWSVLASVAPVIAVTATWDSPSVINEGGGKGVEYGSPPPESAAGEDRTTNDTRAAAETAALVF